MGYLRITRSRGFTRTVTLVRLVPAHVCWITHCLVRVYLYRHRLVLVLFTLVCVYYGLLRLRARTRTRLHGLRYVRTTHAAIRMPGYARYHRYRCLRARTRTRVWLVAGYRHGYWFAVYLPFCPVALLHAHAPAGLRLLPVPAAFLPFLPLPAVYTHRTVAVTHYHRSPYVHTVPLVGLRTLGLRCHLRALLHWFCRFCVHTYTHTVYVGCRCRYFYCYTPRSSTRLRTLHAHAYGLRTRLPVVAVTVAYAHARLLVRSATLVHTRVAIFCRTLHLRVTRYVRGCFRRTFAPVLVASSPRFTVTCRQFTGSYTRAYTLPAYGSIYVYPVRLLPAPRGSPRGWFGWVGYYRYYHTTVLHTLPLFTHTPHIPAIHAQVGYTRYLGHAVWFAVGLPFGYMPYLRSSWLVRTGSTLPVGYYVCGSCGFWFALFGSFARFAALRTPLLRVCHTCRCYWLPRLQFWLGSPAGSITTCSTVYSHHGCSATHLRVTGSAVLPGCLQLRSHVYGCTHTRSTPFTRLFQLGSVPVALRNGSQFTACRLRFYFAARVYRRFVPPHGCGPPLRSGYLADTTTATTALPLRSDVYRYRCHSGLRYIRARFVTGCLYVRLPVPVTVTGCYALRCLPRSGCWLRVAVYGYPLLPACSSGYLPHAVVTFGWFAPALFVVPTVAAGCAGSFGCCTVTWLRLPLVAVAFLRSAYRFCWFTVPFATALRIPHTARTGYTRLPFCHHTVLRFITLGWLFTACHIYVLLCLYTAVIWVSAVLRSPVVQLVRVPCSSARLPLCHCLPAVHAVIHAWRLRGWIRGSCRYRLHGYLTCLVPTFCSLPHLYLQLVITLFTCGSTLRFTVLTAFTLRLRLVRTFSHYTRILQFCLPHTFAHLHAFTLHTPCHGYYRFFTRFYTRLRSAVLFLLPGYILVGSAVLAAVLHLVVRIRLPRLRFGSSYCSSGSLPATDAVLYGYAVLHVTVTVYILPATPACHYLQFVHTVTAQLPPRLPFVTVPVGYTQLPAWFAFCHRSRLRIHPRLRVYRTTPVAAFAVCYWLRAFAHAVTVLVLVVHTTLPVCVAVHLRLRGCSLPFPVTVHRILHFAVVAVLYTFYRARTTFVFCTYIRSVLVLSSPRLRLHVCGLHLPHHYAHAVTLLHTFAGLRGCRSHIYTRSSASSTSSRLHCARSFTHTATFCLPRLWLILLIHLPYVAVYGSLRSAAFVYARYAQFTRLVTGLPTHGSLPLRLPAGLRSFG